jgi:hypothetical protein
MKHQPQTWRIRLELDHTPSPNDPSDARDFYYMLGVFIIAWGRLENHFLHDIVMLFNLQVPPKIAKRVPMTCEKRLEFWERAFAELPSLGPRRDDAMLFHAAMADLATDRNFISHAQWGRFDAGPPLRIEAAILKNKKGTQLDMEHGKIEVTLDQLIKIAATADHLNMQLYPLSSFLMSLRGVPPIEVKTP